MSTCIYFYISYTYIIKYDKRHFDNKKLRGKLGMEVYYAKRKYKRSKQNHKR